MGKSPLTFEQVGTDNYSVDAAITAGIAAGASWAHLRTGGLYKVTGFNWDAERDLWLVNYKGDPESLGPAASFSRSIPNFLARFTKLE